MINGVEFKKWLEENGRSPLNAKDITSRMRRADRMLPWDSDEIYEYKLAGLIAKQELSTSSKSQIRSAARLYRQFIAESKENEAKK